MNEVELSAYRGFNSKMVRLEECALCHCSNIRRLFQFQDGAIRGRVQDAPFAVILPFQFQDGAIRGHF